jgi:Ca2+-binding RTX toxin-like protein
MRRTGKQLLCGLVVALCAGVAPPTAAAGPPAQTTQDDFYGVTLRYAGEFGGFRIAAASTFNDVVNVTSASGDIRIFSATGIADPIPPFCVRGDSMFVRCPLTGLTEVEANLGPGNDVWGVGITQGIDAAALEVFIAYLGAGRDQAAGGIVPNEIHGGGGRDDILGGPARDLLFGDGKNDILFGLGGNDRFRCGKGNRDRFNDGAGRDVVDLGTCEIRIGGKL